MNLPFRQTADALHELMEWLRVTLSSIGDAVITTDTQGNVTFLNPVAQTLTGWTEKEALGARLDQIFNILNEENGKPAENSAMRALREGLVVDLANNTLLLAKDGTQRLIENSAAPIRNRQDEVCGVVLIFRDITERRQAERAVQRALDFAENIIATLREPFLVVLDHDLRVMRASGSFFQTFQVSQEQTENRLIYELGNRQWDIPKLRSLLEEILPANGSFHDFEVDHEFPVIGHRIMLLNARRVQGPKGSEELILLAIEDVTERRQIERMHTQAEVSADRNRLKDEFLAMLSHELRNPLAPILNAVQLLALEHERETPLQRQARTIIERQSANLKVIVDELLEASRITSGRINLHAEDLDFRGVVEGAVESVQPLFHRHRHELTVSLPSGPIWLHADHTRIEQVIVNLLTNAAKYTLEGGHVWLSLEVAGPQAVLSVRDTGIGIAPESLPRIFELFTQADRSLDRAGRVGDRTCGRAKACGVAWRDSRGF